MSGPAADPSARTSRLAAYAPDFMGAAVRSTVSQWSDRADRAVLDAWRWCPDPAVAAAPPADLTPRGAARRLLSRPATPQLPYALRPTGYAPVWHRPGGAYTCGGPGEAHSTPGACIVGAPAW